jgi:hypothetical protein
LFRSKRRNVPPRRADDPATLGSDFRLLWTPTDSGNFVAFEMAGGTLGQKLAPASRFSPPPSAAMSSNGDGLYDCWKNASRSDGKPINYAGT